MNFELHELVYILGILGTLAGLARFYFTRRSDRDEITVWRTKVDNRLENVEGYTKRIEREYKEKDDEHGLAIASVAEEVRNGFADIRERLVRMETSIDAHRKAQE